MKYELAKKLLDAGFPMQKALPGSIEHSGVWGGPDTGGTYYQYPMLADLLMLCGREREFDVVDGNWEGKSKTGIHLLFLQNEWVAGYTFRFDDTSEVEESGETPEEAVARLWLILQKMTPEDFKKALDKAEQVGFDRGVMTILEQILLQIEQSGMLAISYKSIKAIAQEYIKINDTDSSKTP